MLLIGPAVREICFNHSELKHHRVLGYGLLVVGRHFISMESLHSSSSLKASFHREPVVAMQNVSCFLGLFLGTYYKGGLGTTSYANKTG